MARKKAETKAIDPKRVIDAEFNLSALKGDVEALAARVAAVEMLIGGVIEYGVREEKQPSLWARLFRKKQES